MANEVMILNSDTDSDQWEEIDSVVDGDGDISLGWYWDSGSSATRQAKCAIRFPEVNVTAGAINYAGLYFWTKYTAEDFDFHDNLPEASGSWDFEVYGIDEDDTASFSSNPLGRTRTTNFNLSENGSEPSKNTWKEITVTGAVNEVMSRGGWSSGNAIGLILDPINSGVAKFATDGGAKETFLVIRKSAEPTWDTTPKNVAAPTFPSAEDYGLKISYPDYSVFTATEAQTYYTSRKRSHKIKAQGVVNTTANVTYNIAHGLAYIPFCTAYVKETGSTKRYKIPRYLPEALFQGQFGSLDTTNGTVQVDATHLKITTTSNCEVYYRIFLDQIS